MDAFIKGIVVFNRRGEKQFVPLDRGLNIISGNSKTGKSALMDIIDWCLCAEICTIPKGVIYDFTDMYILYMHIKGKEILFCRDTPKLNKKQIIIQQLENEIRIEDLTKDMIVAGRLSIEKALEKINSIIFPSSNDLFDTIVSNSIRLSINDTLGFLFQQQDIISSKKVLFGKKVIKNAFPIYAGWYPLKYYNLLKEKEQIDKDLRALEKEKTNVLEFNRTLEQMLRNSLESFFDLLSKPLSKDLSFSSILKLAQSSLDYKEEEYDLSIQSHIIELESQRDELISQYEKLEKQEKELKGYSSTGVEYATMVSKYSSRANELEKLLEGKNIYNCPLCQQQTKELTPNALKIKEGTRLLRNELSRIPDNMSSIKKLQTTLGGQKVDVGTSIKQINNLLRTKKELLKKIINGKNLNELRFRQKMKVISCLEFYSEKKKVYDEDLLAKKQARADFLSEVLSSYDPENKYLKEQMIIENRCNLIMDKLDYEHKPSNVSFNLNPTSQCMVFKQKIQGFGTVTLSEMGSASNVLACHLGITLSLLSYFTSKKDSIVPSFLFLDQPSQVYFQNGKDDTDLLEVINIYRQLLFEIKRVKEESGIEPQIIITDHIIDFGDEVQDEFAPYFRTDWREGRKFINIAN